MEKTEIKLLYKYLLSTYYMPGASPGAGDTATKKMEENLCSYGVYMLEEEKN